MRKPHVAIVGAGIAGLTAAAFLHRAGTPFHLYEKAADLRTTGAGIHITPNAARILHGLGLKSYLSAHAVPLQALTFSRWDDDSLLARMPLENSTEIYGAPYYAVHRGDLHEALQSQIPDSALDLGAHCSALTEHSDGVTAVFASGQSADADVLIGADGIHSTIRSSLTSDTDTPRYTGHVMYRAFVDADRFPNLASQARLWIGPDQHFVCYPISAGRLLYFGATMSVPDWQHPDWAIPGDLGELAAAYSDWNDNVQSLIAAATAVSLWALYDRDPIYRGSSRTTLIGDAAHPMLPFMAQAANQAIEDAAVLTSCLKDAQLPGTAALRRYEEIRKPRLTAVRKLSRANAETFHLSDGLAQKERDKTLHRTWNTDSLTWLFGHDAANLPVGP